MEKPFINSLDDLFKVLDQIFPDEASRWDLFFSKQDPQHPLASTRPDENLVEYMERNLIQGNQALDIGCGNGRNTRYLAQQGFHVDAIDISQHAIEKARILCLSETTSIQRGESVLMRKNYWKFLEIVLALFPCRI